MGRSIYYCRELEGLYTHRNELTEVDLNQITYCLELKHLYFSSNKIIEIDLKPLREEQRILLDFTLFDNQKDNYKQPVEKQLKQLTPYKVILIRLKGTNKTEKIDHSNKGHGRMQVPKGKGNCLDPVRGCSSYANPEYPRCAWDCYSEEAVRRYKK